MGSQWGFCGASVEPERWGGGCMGSLWVIWGLWGINGGYMGPQWGPRGGYVGCEWGFCVA